MVKHSGDSCGWLSRPTREKGLGPAVRGANVALAGAESQTSGHSQRCRLGQMYSAPPLPALPKYLYHLKSKPIPSSPHKHDWESCPRIQVGVVGPGTQGMKGAEGLRDR